VTGRNEKDRNAYKRYWRNMRNYRQAVDQMAELDARADRSLHLALDALRADLSEWASKQEAEL
jgi:hypothetical protein